MIESTAAVVVIFAVAVAMHAAGSIGAARGLCAVALSGGIGFSAEILGVHAGIPFGSYGYAASRGRGAAYRSLSDWRGP